MQRHLAQVDIGRFLAPPDDPSIADFMAGLDRIDALADAGHVPSVAEAMERVATLDAHGPTAAAFTFRERFGPTEEPDDVAADPRGVCRV